MSRTLKPVTPKPLTNFIVKVASLTLILGIALGDLVVYIVDRYQHVPYDSNWDNPFLDFIFFLLIGVGEAIIPVFVFYVIVKIVGAFNIPYQRLLIYLSGLICTGFPFFTIYYMVNEGYHRHNVLIYAVCTLLSLVMSYWMARGDLRNVLILSGKQE